MHAIFRAARMVPSWLTACKIPSTFNLVRHVVQPCSGGEGWRLGTLSCARTVDRTVDRPVADVARLRYMHTCSCRNLAGWFSVFQRQVPGRSTYLPFPVRIDGPDLMTGNRIVLSDFNAMRRRPQDSMRGSRCCNLTPHTRQSFPRRAR